MTKYNWNYEELGFKSEAEMKGSIARVERRMKMGDVEREIERRREAQSGIDERGRIDFTALNEGARLEALDRVVHDRILYEKEQAKRKAEQEEMQELLSATADSLTAEKEAEAQREYERRKEETEAKLREELNAKHNVNIQTEEEKEKDEALSKMLEGLIK